MAERGVDDNDDNPFSFKTFVNVKEKKVNEKKDVFSNDEEDIFATADRRSSKKEKPKQDDKGVKKTRPKENPFSFKKFLAGSSTSSASSSNTKTSATSAPLLPPDIASDINDIPSLQPNHFGKEPPVSALAPPELNGVGFSIFGGPAGNKSTGSNLSDLTDNSGNGTERASPTGANSLKLSLFDDDSEKNAFGDGSESSPAGASGGLQLPDFLSDGPLHSSKHKAVNSIPESDKRDQDLLHQIHILQDENNRLHSEVSRLKQKCGDKNQRLTQLKNDMERLKKKEAEETAVMEKAVQQVEENLVTTTKRAVQAETTVSKLKQEVKSLQNQVKSLTLENELYRQGDSGLSDIRERTKYTSDQLSLAAGKAEKNLKELLSGVDQLRLWSQVLASWEKITDVNPEQETSPPPEDKTSS